MGPRSTGFDEIEAGFARQAAEEDEQPREPENHDQEDEEDEASTKTTPKAEEEDELALAEREYLNEMRTGMHVSEEDGVAV